MRYSGREGEGERERERERERENERERAREERAMGGEDIGETLGIVRKRRKAFRNVGRH